MNFQEPWLEIPEQLPPPYVRPGFVMARVVNPIVKAIGAPTLTVSGRKSRLPITIPLNPFQYRGATYLVGGGGDTNWVRNLRASGEGLLRIRGGSASSAPWNCWVKNGTGSSLPSATRWGRVRAVSFERCRGRSITPSFASSSFWVPLQRKRRSRRRGCRPRRSRLRPGGT